MLMTVYQILIIKIFNKYKTEKKVYSLKIVFKKLKFNQKLNKILKKIRIKLIRNKIKQILFFLRNDFFILQFHPIN